MKRMAFIATCSPSCAQFVKKLNAERFQERLPIAARCIKEDHYVDDMLTSQEEICDAIKLPKDVLYVHEGSLCTTGYQTVKKNVDEQQKNISLEPTVTTQKVLGWDPVVTLQETWRINVGWDDEVPQPIYEMWSQWLAHLSTLQSISIPRCYRISVKITECNIQLHVFVGASKDGYTAVAYFRYETNDHVEVALIGGKTRVAPLKYTSVPSQLYKFSPQLDTHGILRVKGRIDACEYLGYETKQPIILPKSGHVTELIVDYYHQKYTHANPPFTYTGIDYFGPLIVLFTCMTVRAVHLEVAFSLSTSSCIIAIRNFIARRGTPREMYCD
uniref:Uncharacterized protein n=1 Tax=Anopheles arabiensis TaxID=7173 RepID=A0A182IES4_ANOAR